jgi:hypothetical protein
MANGRCTTEGMLERVGFVQDLLAAGRRTSSIQQALRDRYGHLGHRQCGVYIARAREANLKALETPRSEAVADSYNFYRSVIADRTNKTRDRIDARTRIDKLLGLELKLPPLEVLCAHLGITVQQLVEFIGEFAGKAVSRGALAAPEAPGPDQVPH